jgi:hypothetical protein
MKIKTLQNLNCTIYATHLHNLCTFPAQFVQIFALFFQKFQTKTFTINTLCNVKIFLTCTNRATFNPISTDNQSSSTCTISSITCTICAPYKANTTHYQQTNICTNHPLSLNPIEINPLNINKNKNRGIFSTACMLTVASVTLSSDCEWSVKKIILFEATQLQVHNF